MEIVYMKEELTVSLNLNREISAIVPSASMVTMAKAKKLKAVDA